MWEHRVGEEACGFADVTPEELDDEHGAAEIDVATDLFEDSIRVSRNGEFTVGIAEVTAEDASGGVDLGSGRGRIGTDDHETLLTDP